MEPPSIEFSWKCTCRLPYRRFIQQATKKMKKNDSQKQPSKLKEYAAVKIVGRRTSNNTPRSQIWSSQSYIFCLVGWVEVAWQQICPQSCNYLFWGLSSWFLFLVSTRQSLWSIAWTHRSYGVVELLEGALKLFLPTGCIFNRAISSKQQNSVDGFKIQKNQQSKQDFLSEFCFDSHHYEWKYFSWKWKWMVIIRSVCSVCHIMKFLNM